MRELTGNVQEFKARLEERVFELAQQAPAVLEECGKSPNPMAKVLSYVAKLAGLATELVLLTELEVDFQMRGALDEGAEPKETLPSL